jgi:hypothetical protein
MKKIILSAVVLGALAIGAMAYSTQMKTPVEFFRGHTHEKGMTIGGAPEHSGGLDRYGCHNGSVPYHCH